MTGSTAAPGAEPAVDAATVRARWHLPELDLRRAGARCAQALWVRVPWIASGLAAAIPVIESTIRAVHAGWVPAGDDGIIATRGWDVLTSHTPLVGQYSEAGLVVHGQLMHSPGPMLYWLIALPARFGSVSSIAVTMGVVNTAAIVACVALARRRGGLPLMCATAMAIALMCQSLPGEAMHDIWNPAAGLFPFLLLVFVCWSIACGEHRLLPLAVLIASYVTQTHLMYAAPTAVVLVVALAGLTLASRHRRRSGPGRQRPPHIRRWPLASLVVAAACWSAPVIDQLEHNPGNFTMIVRTVEHRGTTLGPTVGWHAVVRSIGIRPWWLYVPATEWDRKIDVLTAASGGEVASTLAILALLVLVVVIGSWWLRFDLVAAALIALGLCGAIGLQAASNPAAPLLAATLGYTMWWGSELGLWVWLILAWAAWLGLLALLRPTARAVRRWLRAHRRAAAPGVRAAAIAVAYLGTLAGTAAVGATVASALKPDSHVYEYHPIRHVATLVERTIAPGTTMRIYTGGLRVGTQPMEAAIRFLLVRNGDRVLANGSLPRLGSYYELYHRPISWTLLLVDGTHRQPHWTLAARVRFRSPWGEETLSAWVRKTAPARRSTRPATAARRRARSTRAAPLS